MISISKRWSEQRHERMAGWIKGSSYAGVSASKPEFCTLRFEELFHRWIGEACLLDPTTVVDRSCPEVPAQGEADAPGDGEDQAVSDRRA